MNSIRLRTNKLFMFQSGCHGSQVFIAMRYEADDYCPNEPPCQIWTQHGTKDKGVQNVIYVIHIVNYLNKYMCI